MDEDNLKVHLKILFYKKEIRLNKKTFVKTVFKRLVNSMDRYNNIYINSIHILLTSKT